MNEQFILQRIDLLESHIRELQRKQDEDIKWKFVVQKWISQNFEFSVHKQLQRPDFLNFNYDPPSACELLGKNIVTAPQLHTLFRRQQEEFGRVLRYVNMNAVNHSTNSSSRSVHPNQCCQGLQNYPNPHQTFPNLPPNQNFPINPHQSYPNPHQSFPVNPHHQGFPNPHPSFSIPHQNLPNPVLNSSGENQNFTSSHQSQSQQEQQKASKQSQQGQHKSKSFENQPQLKRSTLPMRIPETLTASLVPPAEQLYRSGSFPGHVTTCVPAPNNNPGLNPNSGADRFPSSSNGPQSFGPPQPQCLSSSLQKMSPQVLGDGSGRSSPSEVEVISVNQSQRQQQASEANPHPHSRHVSTSSGPGSNSNSNSNLSPAMAGTGSHNNSVHRAPDPPNFSQFINDLSRMCEPLNPNPIVGPPVNFGPGPTPTMHLDQYTCNQCHLILPNKHVADMHFEAVHSFPPRPLYSYPNFNQHNQTNPHQLPPPAPLPSRPQSKTKNKFDQLQKRHSSNSISTAGTGTTHLPHPDVHSQAQTLTHMPQSIPVLQPQVGAGQAQSAHDNNSDQCEEASFIKIVSIQSGGKRYVRKSDHQSLGGDRHPAAVVGFNTAQAQPPPPYPEEKHRRKRKNVVLDEITLSDNDEPNENPSNPFNPGNLTPPFTSESESRDSNEQNQIIGLESELSGHPARSPPFAMSPHHVVTTYASVINNRDSLGKSPHPPLAGSPLARCTSRSRNSTMDTNLASAEEQGRSDSRPGARILTSSPIIPLVAAVESEPIIVAPEINLYTSSLDLEETSSNSTSNFNATEDNSLSVDGSCRNAQVLQQHPSRSPPMSSSNMHSMLSTSTSSQQTRNFDSYVMGVHNNIRTNVVQDMINNYGSGQGQESQSVLVREPADNYLAVLDNEEVEMDMDFKPCVHIL